MPRLDRVIIVDWSAATVPSPPTPAANAIWIGLASAAGETTLYQRTRAQAAATLTALLDQAPAQRTLLGFDFAFAYPQGFARALTGTDDPRQVWHWLADHLADDAGNRNNRLDLASAINARLGGPGPFWVANPGLARPHLPCGKSGIAYATLGLAEFREIEASRLAGRPKSPWQLTGPGAVGSQSLTGLPLIARLARRPGTAVWPFDAPDAAPDAALVLAEVYPSLLAAEVAASADPIKDRAQVRLLARALWRLAQQNRLAPLFETPAAARLEGWILGAGARTALQDALR